MGGGGRGVQDNHGQVRSNFQVATVEKKRWKFRARRQWWEGVDVGEGLRREDGWVEGSGGGSGWGKLALD